ncbi:MAG: aminotransferase class V-fold PLP-dependent enzyme [Alphaproteobacteria bacterium]|nr:aminotransferase class V-fold PLP-dependent enzyme [Alphaproteobacteria bacterium]
MITERDCRALDEADPIRSIRDRFTTPGGDVIYLDANSMGAMPKDVPARLERLCLNGWVAARRRGWTQFDWLDLPHDIGASIAPFIGADPKDVIVADSTSVNLFKILAFAWHRRSGGKVILSERANFPTDIYVAEGLCRLLGKPVLELVESKDELIPAIGQDVAIVYLSLVDYRTSERWDMADITKRAHEAGALVVWDLSHAAGAVPVDLLGSKADFAVGCGYKYLSGGPGCPAYIYVRADHQDDAWPAIAGWIGHADYFAFADRYEPGAGVNRFMTGTPGVVANEVFSAAAAILRDVDPVDLFAKHRSLSQLTKDLLAQECAGFGIEVVSPADYDHQGGHIAFRAPGAGSVTEALLAHGVVSSFRRPEQIRFGLGPLYLSHHDVWVAVSRLKHIMEQELWRAPEFENVSI